MDIADKSIGKAIGAEDTSTWLSAKLKTLSEKLKDHLPTEDLYKDYGAMFEPSGHTFGLGGA